MTHFIGAVLVPSNIPTKIELVKSAWPSFSDEDRFDSKASAELDEYLARAVAKFDENTSMEPYEEEPSEYRQDAATEVEKAIAYFTELDAKRSTWEPYRREDNENSIREINRAKLLTEPERTLKILSLWSGEDTWKLKDDGTIAAFTTYNPDSKWDWYVIGGRWTQEYKDRQGELASDIAAQIRKRLEHLAIPGNQEAHDAAFKELSETYDAKVRDYYGAGADEAKRKKIGEELDKINEQIDALPGHISWRLAPSQIVVPTDDTWTQFEWAQRGRNGWWGTFFEDIGEKAWHEALLTILEKHADARVIYVDFHI